MQKEKNYTSNHEEVYKFDKIFFTNRKEIIQYLTLMTNELY